MPHIFIKSLKVGLWVVLTLIFTSSSSIEEKPDKKILAAGSYMLNIAGERQLKLEGIINFETTKKCSPKGKEYAIIKLILNDNQELPGHSLEFILSKQYQSMNIGHGRHEISENIEGFLNYFDGVFAFANINQFGELPFFAKNGAITIDDINDRIIKGSINVVFENPNDKIVGLNGEFSAFRK